MSFHHSFVAATVLLSGSSCTSTVPSLSSSIVPGVPNGGGFASGVQGDAVPAGLKSGEAAFDPDGTRCRNGVRIGWPADTAGTAAICATLGRCAAADGAPAITSAASAARHPAAPAMRAKRRLIDNNAPP